MSLKAKSLLVFIALFIITGGAFVLVFNHKDTLIQNVPDTVEFYAHTNPNLFSKLTTEHQETVLALSTQVNLSKEQLKNVFEHSKKEIAIFKHPHKSFQLLTFNNKDLKKYLRTSNIPFTENNTLISFPETESSALKQTNQSLKNHPAYTHSNISFTKVRMYFAGGPVPFVPLYLGEQSPIDSFTAEMKYKDQVFIIQTSIPAKETNINSAAEVNTNEIKLWANGIDSSQLSFQASREQDNFKYLLLKELKQNIEYIDWGDSFAIISDADTSSVDQLQDIVSYTISYLKPSETQKELPDGTSATHLVVKPEDWQFKQLNSNTWSLNVKELDLNIQLAQLASYNEQILMTVNLPIDEFQWNQDNLAKTSNTLNSKCPTKSKNFLFINPNRLNYSNSLKSIIISSSKQSKIAICVD